MLEGAMTSTSTIRMTGAFSVGHAASLTWDLPRPRSLALNGYNEVIKQPIYRFSIRPSWSRLAAVQGNLVTRFHWNSPPSNTVIRVVEQLDVTIRSSLSPFRSAARFPLGPVPANVRPYTHVTRLLHLFQTGQRTAHRLAAGSGSEQAVVEAVANWVATHIHYDADRANGPFRASWVMRHGGTTCRGYANAMASLLRYLGIPAQVEYGWVSALPINVTGPSGSSSTIQWGTPGSSGEMHGWLHIYFPGSGWVPFDPQHEKFFIDPRHFGFATYADARGPRVGSWSAETVDGDSVTGKPLSDGYTEIAPADGIGSDVTIRSRDSFHAALEGIHHDVSGVLLLSR